MSMGMSLFFRSIFNLEEATRLLMIAEFDGDRTGLPEHFDCQYHLNF
jgi:hypothetical protein